MTRVASAVVIVSIVVVAGCAGLSSPEAVRERVSSVTGNTYERTGGVTIGRGPLSFARWVDVEEEGEEPGALQALSKVQVGVYKQVERKDPTVSGRSLRAEDFRGWEPQLAIQGEEGEDVLLLTTGFGRSVKRMLLVVDGKEKLVVVLLDGELDRILEEAKKIAFEEAERPDLIDRENTL